MAPSSKTWLTNITELLLKLELTHLDLRLARMSQDIERMQGRMRDAMLERDLNDKERELSAHANELTMSSEHVQAEVLHAAKREALERERGEVETELARAREAHAAEVKRVLDEVASSESSIAQMFTQFEMLERDLDKARELSAHANQLTMSSEHVQAEALHAAKREALERERGEAETELARAREAHAAEVKRVLDEMASSKSSIAQMITQFEVQFSTLIFLLDDEDQCKECVVCKESRKEYAFLPCGHMCVCEGCAALIQGQDRTCPLCRGVSTFIMKIFH